MTTVSLFQRLAAMEDASTQSGLIGLLPPKVNREAPVQGESNPIQIRTRGMAASSVRLRTLSGR
jgi:hypothetical protein